MSPRATLALALKSVRLLAVTALLLGFAMTAAGCGRESSATSQVASCCAAKGSSETRTAPVEDLALDRITIPASPLVDQDGRPVDMASDLIGTRVAAIQFIFTRCATTCPILASQFQGVRDSLGDGMGQDFALVSITVDPEYDSPDMLKAWGRRHGIGPGWSLLTGTKSDVDRLLRGLGMPAAEPQNHQSQVVVVDGTTGQGLRTSGLASAAELVAILRRVKAARPAVQPVGLAETAKPGLGARPRRWRGRGTLLHEHDPGGPVGQPAPVLPRSAS